MLFEKIAFIMALIALIVSLILMNWLAVCGWLFAIVTQIQLMLKSETQERRQKFYRG